MARSSMNLEPRLIEQLKQAVEKSGIPKGRLAEDLNCHRTTLYKWLNNTKRFPLDELKRLFDLIDLPDEQRMVQLESRGYVSRPPSP